MLFLPAITQTRVPGQHKLFEYLIYLPTDMLSGWYCGLDVRRNGSYDHKIRCM
jgi:hypothetical protein